jgi:hypothetical protein
MEEATEVFSTLSLLEQRRNITISFTTRLLIASFGVVHMIGPILPSPGGSKDY